MGKNAIDAIDVASYILSKTGKLTTMKLQKLVYYSQAWSLVWDGKPLFEEDFQAWANGPVCPSLFKKHKGKFVIDKTELKSDATFTDVEKETIDAVLEYYGEKDAYWLSELTHAEAPWKIARGNCPPGQLCNSVITKESMQEYYGSL